VGAGSGVGAGVGVTFPPEPSPCRMLDFGTDALRKGQGSWPRNGMAPTIISKLSDMRFFPSIHGVIEIDYPPYTSRILTHFRSIQSEDRTQC